MEEEYNIGVPDFRKLKKKKKRKDKVYKKKIPRMLRGMVRTCHEYDLQLYYGYDTDWVAGYVLTYNTSNTVYGVYPPNGSTVPHGSAWNKGSLNPWTFGSPRALYSGFMKVPLTELLGSGLQGSNSFGDHLSKFLYYKVRGVSVAFTSMITSGGCAFFNDDGVSLNTVTTTMGAIPDIDVNFIDNIGIMSYSGLPNYRFDKLDRSDVSNGCVWGDPQRSEGSKKFTINRNDVYQSAYFKFGEYNQRPQLVYSRDLFNNPVWFTLGSVGHWNKSMCCCTGDPNNETVQLINGSIVFGFFPICQLSGDLRQDSLQNRFDSIGVFKITVYVDWAGEYNYININGP